MSSNQGPAVRTDGGHAQVDNRTPRRSTETKMATKTTELIVYVVAVLAVAITALMVSGNDEGTQDPFGAAEALRYITWLSIGYMIARGLAKSGSRESYNGS
ncbi:hypothetical protein [Rhodococcus sp. X156]|uniref:hypothetical protein n=1 Tax=Rhodococcus sp. X156 TaxID=2499145 RepID=UPI000FDA9DEE|nr:hypothetical protein [Rhodococcus sp. X156]